MTALLAISSVLLVCTVAAQYSLVGEPRRTTFGLEATLHYSGGQPAGSDTFTTLNAAAVFLDNDVLRLQLMPTNISAGQKAPYLVPGEVLPGNDAAPESITAASHPSYQLRVDGDNIVVTTTTNGDAATLVSIALSSIVAQAQHVAFRTLLSPAALVSGYGEHNFYYFLPRDGTTLSLWNTDNGSPWEKPLYGVHPVLFIADPSQPLFYAFFWANSNAQQMTLDATGGSFLSVGGVVDLYVITGETMLDVIARYHRVIGPTSVPPYWALGTHQCRWGYRNVSDLEEVVEGYKQADMPLEVMWSDIDYMDKFRIFTTDPVHYPEAELRAFIDTLHENKQRYVQIIDPGVATALNYSVYSNGVAQDAFIKVNGDILVNVVWPGWTAFPDFTAEAGSSWWAAELNAYLDRIPLDGVWLDMNEPGTFCGGSCPVAPGTPWRQDWHTVDWNNFNQNICLDQGNCSAADSPLNNPAINPLTNGWFLFNKTLDMTAELGLGLFYNTKTFYAMMECVATHKALQTRTNTRPFILSRASYIGAGRVTAHWTGDNSATWERRLGGIQDSIQGVLGSNLWGVAVVGADIGGFSGTSTEELVTRWTQLGAYYTFMRNHHDLNGGAQEPYLFSKAAQDTMREAMNERYRLLPYTFTGLLQAHYRGGVFLRHLSVQFPQDIATYTESFQFMFGPSILVTPVVVQGATSVPGYVPAAASWYQLWTGAPVRGGRHVNFSCPLYSPLPILVAGGAALPLHTSPKLTVAATRATGISLLCALDATGGAVGELWLDDGADGILPADVAQLRRASIQCAVDLASGGRRGLVHVKRLDAERPDEQLPGGGLAEPATVTVYMPAPGTSLDPESTVFAVNGKRYVPKDVVSSAQSNVFVLDLPRSVDGSADFSLEWWPRNGSSEAPTVSKEKYDGAVAAAVVMGVLLFFATVAATFFRRRIAEEKRLLGMMQ